MVSSDATTKAKPGTLPILGLCNNTYIWIILRVLFKVVGCKQFPISIEPVIISSVSSRNNRHKKGKDWRSNQCYSYYTLPETSSLLNPPYFYLVTSSTVSSKSQSTILGQFTNTGTSSSKTPTQSGTSGRHIWSRWTLQLVLIIEAWCVLVPLSPFSTKTRGKIPRQFTSMVSSDATTKAKPGNLPILGLCNNT